MTETYHLVCNDADLCVGQLRAQIINGWPILVCRTEQGVYAVIDRCTHAASPLGDGRVRRNTIACPLHGARFDLTTGKCLGAQYRPLKTFPLRTVDGRIEVAVPDERPGVEYQPVRAQSTG